MSLYIIEKLNADKNRSFGYLSMNKARYSRSSCGLFNEEQADDFISKKEAEIKYLKEKTNNHPAHHDWTWRKIKINI